MDKLISKLASLGIPSLILIVAIDASGYVGAAAITTALAALGPGGMIGGILFLGVIGVLVSSLTDHGVELIFTKVITQLIINGETLDDIEKKIKSYPISKELKLKLNELIKTIKSN